MHSSTEAFHTLLAWKDSPTFLYAEFSLVGETPFVTSVAKVYELSEDSVTLFAGALHDFDLSSSKLEMGKNIPQEFRKRFVRVVTISLDDGGRVLLAEPFKA